MDSTRTPQIDGCWPNAVASNDSSELIFLPVFRSKVREQIGHCQYKYRHENFVYQAGERTASHHVAACYWQRDMLSGVEIWCCVVRASRPIYSYIAPDRYSQIHDWGGCRHNGNECR